MGKPSTWASKPFFRLGVLLLLLSGCNPDRSFTEPENLSTYMEENVALPLSTDLIACADSLPVSETDTTSSIALFFYLAPGAFDFRCFTTSNAFSASSDYAYYLPVELESVPVFGGHLRKFSLPLPEQERWGVVTYRLGNKLHICNPVRFKGLSEPTTVSPEVDINGSGPSFCWDGTDARNAIYFQVVSEAGTNATANLISGTYTFESCFTFYALDNVVLNVTPADSEPALNTGDTYRFTNMGVSLDNWVNEIVATDFIAP